MSANHLAVLPPPIEQPRLSLRILALTVAAAGMITAGLMLWLIGDRWVGMALLSGFIAVAALIILSETLRRGRAAPSPSDTDWTLFRAIADSPDEAVAITDADDRLVCASASYGRWFGTPTAPQRMTLPADGAAKLAAAGSCAWRDGQSRVAALPGPGGKFDLQLRRAGRHEDHLIWRFRHTAAFDAVAEARHAVQSRSGIRLGEAGVMTAVSDSDGRLIAANPLFAARALGDETAAVEGIDFADLFATREDGALHLVREADGPPLRFIRMTLQGEEGRNLLSFLILDERAAASGAATDGATASTLLSMLPLGLALADRDGRLLILNKAFRKAAGLGEGDDEPVYPSDLAVKEDKAVVADAVRRFANGQGTSTDLAIHLKHRPEEPVALTIAAAKGLGDGAILLSLKDNAEESKLKRQIAQATKMQAVGQLAGGVAHDFNNILTAIIGYCDLILMRHTPGDSDYDDIQQIKHNSNRAAGLTRQLLAFSRQQTLRPQVLQLPDVVAEVSNLLKRLIGENMTLVTKHGRSLGAVRADPGQLEQVIVNLAVNARDAMPDGGTLTLHTYAVSADDVRRLATDIMPFDDYTALSVTDSGSGIPPAIIANIFEPFFTTKEVGKGTGLGLSTVYGIVKQTGGFIFADNVDGGGARFTMYLPVHRLAPRETVAIAPVEKAGEVWGSGNILLVEDEDMVRAVAERALVRQGYRVTTAANGEEALEMLQAGAGPFDLLVTDVMMPAMDGPTLVRHAREGMPDLPILFMSGYAEEQLRRSIDLDHVHFLPKPFSVQQLAEAARDALATGQLAVAGS